MLTSVPSSHESFIKKDILSRMCYFYVFVKNLMFFVKKLLTSIKRGGIVQLTINIKTFTFIVHFIARVLKIKNKQLRINN